MASDLQVKTSPRPQSRLALEVLVPATRCQRSYDKALRSLCRTVRLPGFRPGRVPQTAVLQQLGTQQVWITALEQLLEDTARDVLNDEDLDLLGKLQLQDSFDALAQQFKPSESLTLNMEADVRPNATLKAYRDLDVKVEELSVEGLLEEVLERQRLAASTKVPVEKNTAELGDVAVIQFSPSPMDKPDESEEPDQAPDTREFDVDLVENQGVMPEIVPLIVGMTVGESKAIPDNTDEPGDSPTNNMSITLRGLKARQLPELDDAFAQKASQFASMDEWKDALSRQLETRVQEGNKEKRQDALLDALCEDIQVELPQSLVDQEMDAVVEDLKNEFRARGLDPNLIQDDRLREQAEEAKSQEVQSRLHRRLALDAVAKAEQLTVPDTELEERVRALRKQFRDKQARKLDSAKLRHFVKTDLLREKALAWLEEHNTFTVQTAPVEDAESPPAPDQDQ